MLDWLNYLANNYFYQITTYGMFLCILGVMYRLYQAEKELGRLRKFLHQSQEKANDTEAPEIAT